MIILAPMQGLTEVMFRKAYEQCFPGAFDYAISPFLSLTHGNLADAWKKIGDVLPENNQGSMPVIPQILGKEPQEFVELANRLGEVGFNEVNWNIGCPMRRVAGKHRGSGILPYPHEIDALLDYVMPRIKVGLSVKMRLGHVSNREIFDIVPILNNYPITNVIIHPRTGKQQYGGCVDMDTFTEVLPLINHKVAYNGDICTADQYRNIKRRFPQVEDVMIGRGVLYDPCLTLKIRDIPCNHQQNITFLNVLMEAIMQRNTPEVSKLRKSKEYWCLIWHTLPITEQQASQVLHTSTLTEFHELLKQLISQYE